MKSALPNPKLQASSISGTVSTGFKTVTAAGRPARLAIIDEHGNIVEVGDAVAWAAWRVCVEVQENFWQGQGHLVVHEGPPESKAAAPTMTGKVAA